MEVEVVEGRARGEGWNVGEGEGEGVGEGRWGGGTRGEGGTRGCRGAANVATYQGVRDVSSGVQVLQGPEILDKFVL